MRTLRFGRGTLVLLGLLGVGWLAGLVSQVMSRLQTGYMDVWPPQLLLGIGLIFGAGAAARLVEPVRRTWRRGAAGGTAIVASIVVGYAVLSVLLWNPAWTERAEEEGETWFSLLIEAPLWIGVALLTGAAFGALGWWVADRQTRA
jgi:hypothetical protein